LTIGTSPPFAGQAFHEVFMPQEFTGHKPDQPLHAIDNSPGCVQREPKPPVWRSCPMKNAIELLFALQELEFKPGAASAQEDAEIDQLRKQIPPPILGHYDRLVARGKKGVAVVRRGVCPECHMGLASGIYAQLIRAEDIVICDTCGRYLLYKPETPPAEPPPPTPIADASKPKSRPRKKKTAAPPAA
jgi:hypothetical protein